VIGPSSQFSVPSTQFSVAGIQFLEKWRYLQLGELRIFGGFPQSFA
jgi:hypothetical protein